MVPFKPELSAWTHSEPQVSLLYRAAMGERLSDVTHFAMFGGAPPDLDYEPFHAILPEKDQSPFASQLYERAIGWLKETKHRPKTGEPIRAFQIVINGSRGEVRSNLGIAGRLWAIMKKTPGNERKLNVQVGFSLLPDESDDTTHITVLGGRCDGRNSALVFCDVIPSGIRRQPASEMLDTIEAGLPPLARGRFKGIRAKAEREGLTEEVRSSLFLAHKQLRDILGDSRGSMFRGLSTFVLEDLERSSRAGLPARGTPVELVPVDPLSDLEKVAGAARGSEPDESPDFAAVGLDARSHQALRLMYVEGRTQAEIAERLGVSQPRVSQIVNAAKERLRRAVRSDQE